MGSQREFHLLGQKIVVKTQEEAELAQHALEVANKKVEALKLAAPKLAPHQLAILALVEVAGDLVKDRKIMDDYRRDLDEKCSYLLIELNSNEHSKSNPKSKAV